LKIGFVEAVQVDTGHADAVIPPQADAVPFDQFEDPLEDRLLDGVPRGIAIGAAHTEMLVADIRIIEVTKGRWQVPGSLPRQRPGGSPFDLPLRIERSGNVGVDGTHSIPGVATTILLLAEEHAVVRMNRQITEVVEASGTPRFVTLKNSGAALKSLAEGAGLGLQGICPLAVARIPQVDFLITEAVETSGHVVARDIDVHDTVVGRGGAFQDCHRPADGADVIVVLVERLLGGQRSVTTVLGVRLAATIQNQGSGGAFGWPGNAPAGRARRMPDQGVGSGLPVDQIERLDLSFEEGRLPAFSDPGLDDLGRQAPGHGQGRWGATPIKRRASMLPSDTVEIAD